MNKMTSTNDKQFPCGAEWVRADFHLHTLKDPSASRKPFREEYRGVNGNGHDKANGFPKDWIGRLKTEQIRVAVVTNHNYFDRDEYTTLRKLGAKEGILVLPGVEIGLKDGGSGIHALIAFNPDGWVDNPENDDRINRFLSTQFQRPPDEGTRTKDDFCCCLEKLDNVKEDYFVVFAHVQSDNGLFKELLGDNLTHMINGCGRRWSERVLGLQKVKQPEVVEKRWPSTQPLPALVEGSDPKCIAEVGKSDRNSYLKLGELSFDAVKFALFDHEHRVRSALPAPRQAVLLREVRFNGGALDGLAVPFSPSLIWRLQLPHREPPPATARQMEYYSLDNSDRSRPTCRILLVVRYPKDSCLDPRIPCMTLPALTLRNLRKTYANGFEVNQVIQHFLQIK